MKPGEVIALLQISDLSEVEEALEMELFELKKSILQKPLLRQTLKAKLLRLQKLDEVAKDQHLFLNVPVVPFQYELVNSDQVLVLWEGYMRAKSQWKMVFSQASTPQQVSALLEEGLKMELDFSQQFPALGWINEDPVFGLEPDPMPVQNSLKKAQAQGWLTFGELEKNKGMLQKELLLALKRLSLLPKYL